MQHIRAAELIFEYLEAAGDQDRSRTNNTKYQTHACRRFTGEIEVHITNPAIEQQTKIRMLCLLDGEWAFVHHLCSVFKCTRLRQGSKPLAMPQYGVW